MSFYSRQPRFRGGAVGGAFGGGGFGGGGYGSSSYGGAAGANAGGYQAYGAVIAGNPYGGGYPALQPAAPQSEGIVAVRQLARDKRDLKDVSAAVDFAYSGAAIASGDLAPLSQDAAAALEEGRKLLDDGKLAEAREKFLSAYFLDAAAANFGASASETAAAALAELEQVRPREIAAWRKEHPQLDNRLQLVIRDKSLPDVLKAIAAATKMDVRTVQGSLDDAAALLDRDELRVSFLDLRGATLAEALDWTLKPLRLEWSLADGAVIVRSARRGAGRVPWVYDVSILALLSPEEVSKEPDDEKRLAKAKEEAEAFLAAIRGELPEGARAEWFAPGQLAVLGDTKAHERIAAAIKLLSGQARGKLGPAAAEIRVKTARRARERQDAIARTREAARRLETVLAHDAYAWPLLAAAAEGRLDLEALTELQIAWRSPQTSKLLEAASPGVLLRSAWAIIESARALEDEAELAALAEQVRKAVQHPGERAVAALKEDPAGVQAAAAALYASLASGDVTFRREAAAAIHEMKGDDPSLAALRTVAPALLARDAQAIDAAPLVELVNAGVHGDDLVALTAIACRRAGGEAWDAFRRQQRDLVGKQPLRGDAVVLVNRLSGDSLPLVVPSR
jgi:hypothetical protein